MHLFEVDAFAAHIWAGDDADPILFISDVGGVWHKRRYAHFLQRMPGRSNSNNFTHLKLSKEKTEPKIRFYKNSNTTIENRNIKVPKFNAYFTNLKLSKEKIENQILQKFQHNWWK